ncbi:DUF262 domain-containing protein [Methylobacterium sp. 092160098-2]|uniref:DUF262 domain-containing protein n=1 Tax=Methylobacterium sp. 092160098-2 TaxID=3025129 RepID=UPI002381C33E|nr:DUF262 domain-containing protein [Methylobacterium sp. 092160098-2]MDE4914232.1 DUF262 domain-containing protein [Methylobacterium sp. 092160098-2]
MTDQTAGSDLRASSFIRGQTCEFTIEIGFMPPRRAADEAAGERALGHFILPPFQRDPAWEQAQQIRFIESIWMRLPIPAYVYNLTQSSASEQPVDYWLIDGQQRWTAVLDYMADRFPVGGYLWSELSQRDQRFFESRPWTCLRTEIEDVDVLKDLYDRLAYGGTPHDPAERAVVSSTPSMR